LGSRPTGITILAVLFAIGGVLGILAGVALLGVGAIAAGSGLGGLAAIFGIIALALGAAEIAEAYGLWTLKPWAWTLGIGLAIVSLAFIVLQAVLSGNIVDTLVSSIISIVIWGVVLWYLMQPQIKAALGRA